MSEYETILVERNVDGQYAVVTLNRPHKLNAGSPTMFQELKAAMEALDGDEDVRAIILTGQGDRAFSAGADLGGMTFDRAADQYRFIRWANGALESIESVPKVVIAAVNGFAFGFGCELTMASDLALASDQARFAAKEMNHGLVPSVTVTRAVDIAGRRRIAWMAFTSDELSAQDAREFGLVNEVVPHDQLDKAARELAVRVAKRAPLAVAVTKRLLNRMAGPDYRDAENFMPGIFATSDVEEGRRAFSERRAPSFEGN